ncbi:MAG TPA: class I SAM-dependent methyltransferase [Thermoanaerobaculia bacterium]|nr:class I SAM-dependent methyltransferase [Thermoanaerobaculia bacterium]
MSVGSRVRRIYDRRPYPPPSLRGQAAPPALPAMEWVAAVSETAAGKVPARILVAGCGVGTEAFALARTFPSAQVLGVDFSARSIALARRLGRKTAGGEDVRFEVADLTARDLVRITGDGFDLVSCHGVLSYVPDAGAVLGNFTRLLAPDGVLVLGVNGAVHPSARWRPVLPAFGFDLEKFRDSAGLRDVIRVLESISVYPPVKVSHLDAGYLAGDLFGPLNRALPLSEWAQLCAHAGLHLFGTHRAFFAVRALLNLDLHALLMPRTRGGVARLVDALQPTSFHHMVLSRRAPVDVPWSDGRALLRWRPVLTSLYKAQWPRRSRDRHALREVELESPATSTRVTLSVPQWEVEILRNSDGTLTLRELLAGVEPAVPAKALREAMYLLYLMGVVNLAAPGARHAHGTDHVPDGLHPPKQRQGGNRWSGRKRATRKPGSRR